MNKNIIRVVFVFLFITSHAHAAEKLKLEKIIVTPSRLATLPDSSTRSVTILDSTMLDLSPHDALQDILGNIGNIDMRRRGPNGAQSDISIRGTTFEQNMALLDGIRMNDAQTGHYTMDIPVTAFDIDTVDILRGPASAQYGPNAFGGAIQVKTRRPGDADVRLESEGGSFDYYRGGASVSCPLGPIKNRTSFEETNSSGYISETDLHSITLTDSALLETGFGVYDFYFGYLRKEFGANRFYSNVYPNERELTDTRYFKLGGLIERDALKIEPKIYLRRHWDKFQLDTNRPGWQTNYHTTYDYGTELNFTYESDLIDAAYGGEWGRDTIDSTSMNTHRRNKAAAYLELSPHIIDRLNVNIGLREDWFSDFGTEFSPSIGVSYPIIDGLNIRGSIARAYRVPTFTDLYYNDAANKGNAGLSPESSWNYETGLDYRKGALFGSGTFFHRDSSDTIDWIRYTSSGQWQAANIGSADTNGFELHMEYSGYRLADKIMIDKIFGGYTVVDTYAKHDYFSKYALDYLKQEITCGLQYDVGGFKNSWVLNYKKRVGESGYVVVDTKISKELFRKKNVSAMVFFEITNLFDKSCSEQSGVPMPGRWIKSGGRIEF